METRNVVIVLGSPRKDGNSAALAAAVAEGAREAGGHVESFLLQGMEIHPCVACDACQESVDAGCVRDDAMQILYSRLRQAHALVIASPIYWFTVSAQTKVFMDRCYALCGPDGNALKGKRIGIALAYADADPYASGAVNAIRTFQDGFRYLDAPIVGIVYGSAAAAGEIKANTALLAKARDLGRELVAGGSAVR